MSKKEENPTYKDASTSPDLPPFVQDIGQKLKGDDFVPSYDRVASGTLKKAMETYEREVRQWQAWLPVRVGSLDISTAGKHFGLRKQQMKAFAEVIEKYTIIEPHKYRVKGHPRLKEGQFYLPDDIRALFALYHTLGRVDNYHGLSLQQLQETVGKTREALGEDDRVVLLRDPALKEKHEEDLSRPSLKRQVVYDVKTKSQARKESSKKKKMKPREIAIVFRGRNWSFTPLAEEQLQALELIDRETVSDRLKKLKKPDCDGKVILFHRDNPRPKSEAVAFRIISGAAALAGEREEKIFPPPVEHVLTKDLRLDYETVERLFSKFPGIRNVAQLYKISLARLRGEQLDVFRLDDL